MTNAQSSKCWVSFGFGLFICGPVVCLRVHICLGMGIMKHCADSHLFENHELIQEVNTLACEEFPDGLFSLEVLRVRGGAHLGRLVPQELCQRVVLQTKR